MTEREKLVELLAQRCEIQSKGCVGCKSNWPGAADCKQERFVRVADHLLANGVTFQTTPVTYERLLEIARKIHCWIFLNTGDEQEVYDKLGLTDEENAVLGYSGQMVVSTNDGGLKNG